MKILYKSISGSFMVGEIIYTFEMFHCYIWFPEADYHIPQHQIGDYVYIYIYHSNPMKISTTKNPMEIDHSIPLIDHIPFIDHTIPLVIYIYTSLSLLSYIPLGICIFHRKIDVYPIASPDSNRLTAPWRMLTSVLAARGEPWLLCDVSIVLHFKKR